MMQHKLPQIPGVYGSVCSRTGGRFTISIPNVYNGSLLPLITVLHWGGPVTPFYGRSILEGLVLPALGELEAIMVAPDCTYGAWDNQQSENDVLELVYYLNEFYNIDLKKNLIMGYSIGGIGCWYLASRNQEQFVGGIIMAAPVANDYLTVEWHIPLFVIHSRQDEYFPFVETAEPIAKLVDADAPVKFLPVDGATHFNTIDMIKPLKSTMPWIHEIWQDKEMNDGR